MEHDTHSKFELFIWVTCLLMMVVPVVTIPIAYSIEYPRVFASFQFNTSIFCGNLFDGIYSI